MKKTIFSFYNLVIVAAHQSVSEEDWLKQERHENTHSNFHSFDHKVKRFLRDGDRRHLTSYACAASGKAGVCCSGASGQGQYCYDCTSESSVNCVEYDGGSTACTPTGSCGSQRDCSTIAEISGPKTIYPAYTGSTSTDIWNVGTISDFYTSPDFTACAPFDCSVHDCGWFTPAKGGISSTKYGTITIDWSSSTLNSGMYSITSYTSSKHTWCLQCFQYGTTQIGVTSPGSNPFNTKSYGWCTGTAFINHATTNSKDISLYTGDSTQSNSYSTTVTIWGANSAANAWIWYDTFPTTDSSGPQASTPITCTGFTSCQLRRSSTDAVDSRVSIAPLSGTSTTQYTITVDTTSTFSIWFRLYCIPTGSDTYTDYTAQGNVQVISVTDYDCSSAYTWTQTTQNVCITTGGSTATVYSGYASYLAIGNTEYCSGPTFSITNSADNTYTGTLVLDTSTGALTVPTSALISNQRYYLRATRRSSAVRSTTQFDFNVICCVGSYSHTNTITQSQTYEIDGNRPEWSMAPFTESPSTCGITSYTAYTTNTHTTLISDFRNSAVSQQNCQAGGTNWCFSLSSNFEVVQTINFYIRVQVTGGGDYVTTGQSSTQLMVLNVICGASSTVITHTGTYDTGRAAVQFINTGSSTWHLSSSWTATRNTPCPMATPVISSSNSAVSTPSGLSASITQYGATAFFQTVPTDTAAHMRYDFYMKRTASGGAYAWSPQYSLVVGCTLADTTWVDASNANAWIIVGTSMTDRYTFSPPTATPSYCATSRIEVRDIVSTPAYGSVQRAASCSGDPCYSLDITNNTFEHVITFKIRSYSTGDVAYHDSPTLQITVDCQNSGGGVAPNLAITDNTAIQTWEFEQFNTSVNYVYWPAFTCDYPQCCLTMNYLVTETNSAASQYVEFTTPALDSSSGSAWSGMIKSQVNVTNLILSAKTIYVHVTNEYGNTLYSQALNYKVGYDCQYDSIQVNPVAVDEDAEGWTDLSSYTKHWNTSYDNYTWQYNLPVLIVNETKNNISWYASAMKYRFTNNASQYCTLQEYQISKVQARQSQLYITEGLYNQIFGIGSTNATFWVQQYDIPVYRWQIYLKAYNGKIWGGDDVQWMIEATINSDVDYTPNMAPFFTVANLPVYRWDVNLTRCTNDNSIAVFDKFNYTLDLPGMVDNSGDHITVALKDPPIYVSVDNSTRKLIFNPTKLNMSHFKYTDIVILLKDSRGGKREIIQKVDVTGTERYNQPCAGRDVWAPAVINRCQKGNEFAKIVYNDRFGNITLKFNESIDVTDWKDFFNKQTISLRIEKQRALELVEPPITDEQLKFSWEITGVKDNLLLIKIKFDNVIYISTESNHDYLVVDVSKALDQFKPYFGSRLLQASAQFDQNGVLIDPSAKANQTGPTHRSFCESKVKLPMQEPQDAAWAVGMGALNTWTNTLLTSFVLAMGIANFFPATLTYVVSYMKYTQMTLHLPMLNTPLPSNLMFFCRNFLKFPKVDVFKNVWGRPIDLLTSSKTKGRLLQIEVDQMAGDKRFAFDQQFDMRTMIPDQFEDLGYETANSMVNTSSLLVFIIMLLFFILVWIILSMCFAYVDGKEKAQIVLSKNSRERKKQIQELKEHEAGWRQRTRNFVKYLQKQLFWRWFFIIFLFGYCEFVIAGVLNMNTTVQSRDYTFNETFGTAFAYICLIMTFVVLPVFYIGIHLEGYEIKFGSKLPDDFAHFGVRRLWWGYFPYYLWYIFHRLCYLFIILAMKHPAMQFVSLFVINLSSLFFIAYYRPFIGRFANNYELFCEFSVCFVTVLFSSFRGLWQDMDTRWQYGTLTIVIILLHGMVCLGVIWYFMFKHGLLVLTYLWRVFKPWYDWFVWQFRLCFKWEEKVETLDDLIPPDQRNAGNSQAFLIIQQIKKEDKKKKSWKINVDNAQFTQGSTDKGEYDDNELNVGEVLNPLKSKFFKGETEREIELRIKQESDEELDEEIVKMQKAIKQTGYLDEKRKTVSKTDLSRITEKEDDLDLSLQDDIEKQLDSLPVIRRGKKKDKKSIDFGKFQTSQQIIKKYQEGDIIKQVQADQILEEEDDFDDYAPVKVPSRLENLTPDKEIEVVKKVQVQEIDKKSFDPSNSPKIKKTKKKVVQFSDPSTSQSQEVVQIIKQKNKVVQKQIDDNDSSNSSDQVQNLSQDVSVTDLPTRIDNPSVDQSIEQFGSTLTKLNPSRYIDPQDD